MRLRFTVFLMLILALAACRNRENAVTNSYGTGVISGEVTVAGGASPAGIEVSVPGTGMVMTLAEDGRFFFAGVPEEASLRFVRDADGIDATMPLAKSSGSLSVEVHGSSAGRRRAAPGPKMKEFEGLIRSVSETELVVFTSHREEVTFALNAQTVIRKGREMLTADDLAAGDRVHVKAADRDGVLTASLVILQNPADDDGGGDRGGTTATANGHVKSLGTSEMVVLEANGHEKTVQVTDQTEIRKYGQRITFSEIREGDKVECRGTRVDATTIRAVQIIVQDPKGRGK
ncbi:MAG TPA: DUF5666 domain-containing protein [Thermoanaerobaculia bacterium]|nr:DUF5666 domain-containing protein [Thermoanaerobaculia bacterium]